MKKSKGRESEPIRNTNSATIFIEGIKKGWGK
jgi:hypothetical protein